MSGGDKKTENTNDVLSGLESILSMNQTAFMTLLGESDRRAENRQVETDKALQELLKSTNKLMLSHTESKKDREQHTKDSAELKQDLKELRKLYYAMNDVVKITAERQNNNSSSISKASDNFHKVVTGLMSAAIIYLVGFKGG